MKQKLVGVLAALWLTILVCTILDIRSPVTWGTAFFVFLVAIRVVTLRLTQSGQLNPAVFDHRGARYALAAAAIAMSLVVLTFAGLQLYYWWRFA